MQNTEKPFVVNYSNELVNWQLVNKTQSLKSLAYIIRSIGSVNDGFIQGTSKIFNAEKMADYCENKLSETKQWNKLTRNYGIRQQAYYLYNLNK